MFYIAFQPQPGERHATVVTYDRATRIVPYCAAGRLAEAVGGKWHRASSAYRLSPAQLRDFEAFARAGMRGDAVGVLYNPADDRTVSRKEAAALLARPMRCTRTPDLFGEAL